MEVNRIVPDLQCALVCEEIRQEANGNFMLIGVLGFIPTPRTPVTAMKLCVFTRWTAGLGQFKQTVRLMAPDQSTVLRESGVKFPLQDVAHHATNVTVFSQVKFDHPGVYHVEVVVDEIMKLRVPLPVVVVQQPAAQGGQKPPPNPGEAPKPEEGDSGRPPGA